MAKSRAQKAADVARKAAQERRAAGLPSVRVELLKALERGQTIHVPTWAEKKGVSGPSVYGAINRLSEEHNINRVTIDGKPHYQLKTKAQAAAKATKAPTKAARPRQAASANGNHGVVRAEIATVPALVTAPLPEGPLERVPAMDETLTVCLLYRNEAGGLEVGLRNGSNVYRAEIKTAVALP